MHLEGEMHEEKEKRCKPIRFLLMALFIASISATIGVLTFIGMCTVFSELRAVELIQLESQQDCSKL